MRSIRLRRTVRWWNAGPDRRGTRGRRTTPGLAPGRTRWADLGPRGGRTNAACIGAQLAAVRDDAEEQHAVEDRDLERRELAKVERREVGERERDEESVLGKVGA